MPKKAIDRDIEIGKRVAQRREELGVSLDAIAEKLGVNRSTIMRYEALGVDPNKAMTMLGLAEALNTTVEWLKGESEDDEHNEYLLAKDKIDKKVSALLDELFSIVEEKQLRKESIDMLIDSIDVTDIVIKNFIIASQSVEYNKQSLSDVNIDKDKVADMIFRTEMNGVIKQLNSIVEILSAKYDKTVNMSNSKDLQKQSKALTKIIKENKY